MFNWRKKAKGFEDALKHTLTFEGGYVNDPDDLGGETNYGITAQTARAHGYDQSMRKIPMSVVRSIYKKSYWDKNRCGSLPHTMASALFDCSVNTGTNRAARMFQKAINDNKGLHTPIAVDGAIGPATLRAFNAGHTEIIRAFFMQAWAAHYVNIATRRPKNAKFLRGWMRRWISNT